MYLVTNRHVLCVELFYTGQKYLLKELRSHLSQSASLSLSQQLQKQLASFDRRTKNYSTSLAPEFLAPTQNCTAIASGQSSADVQLESNPSASGTANSDNQHLPAAEARQSEENAASAHFASPVSARHDSAGGTSQHGASSPSYYSEDESDAVVSHVADDNHSPHHFSDDDDDDEDEFDAYESDERSAGDFDVDEVDVYSEEESSVDEEYRARHYNESDDEQSELSAVPRGTDTDTDSDSDSRDRRRLNQSAQHRGVNRCAREDEQQIPAVNEDDEGDDDVHQQQPDRTGSSHRLRDEQEPGDNEQPEYAVIGGESAVLSEEQERLTVRLRLNSHRSDGVGLSADAVQPSLVDDAAVGSDAPDHYQHMSDVNPRDSLSSVDSADDASVSASLPASPALQDDDDEVFSPSFSQSDAHDDNDADGGRDSCDEDLETTSQRPSLCSRSHGSRPVSPSVSSRSSSCVYDDNIRQQSSRAVETSRHHSSTASDSHASYTSVDSDEDSDDRWSPADRRRMKRQRSASSATDSDDDNNNTLATHSNHRRHKLFRF